MSLFCLSFVTRDVVQEFPCLIDILQMEFVFFTLSLSSSRSQVVLAGKAPPCECCADSAAHAQKDDMRVLEAPSLKIGRCADLASICAVVPLRQLAYPANLMRSSVTQYIITFMR
jgi:hypothetical protein